MNLASTLIVQDAELEAKMQRRIEEAFELLPHADDYPSIKFPIKGIRIEDEGDTYQVNFEIIRNYTEGTAHWTYKNMRLIPKDQRTGTQKRQDQREAKAEVKAKPKRKRRTKAQIEADKAAAEAAEQEKTPEVS